MKRVLFITYYIPPAGGGGVQRSSKSIKYLPDFGWQPVVLTVEPAAYRLTDPSLLADLPPHTPIYRTGSLRLPARTPWRVRNFLTRWLFLIDEQIGWLPAAVSQGKKLLEEDGIAAIYSSSAPYTAHLAAYSLKKRSGLPWIADFRDPWLGNFSNAFSTAWRRRVAERWEARVVQSAERVVSVSGPLCAAFQARYPNETPAKFVVIPNGYDPQDFASLSAGTTSQPLEAGQDFLEIVFSGSLYGSRQTPEYFFQALKLTCEKISQARIHVSLVGNLNPSFLRLVSQLGLEQVVQSTGYLPHLESIRRIRQADLLLLIIGAGPEMEGVMTGKIYEYLAAQKPILALAPPGGAADLIRAARAGTVVPPDDPHAISAALVELYQRWLAGQLTIASDQAVVAAYDRRALAGRLAQTLDQICSFEQ